MSDFGGEPEDVRVQLAAAAFVAGLLQLEAAVSEQLRRDGTLPSRRRLEALLDETDRFVRAGLEAP